ncbi:hypothetical protein [Mycobacterium sp. 050128]|uniref:hypothetical protein n=1 Tax=Mycobacterium sp. 050128 TaxID=3096112 RepID=UPI003FA560C1
MPLQERNRGIASRSHPSRHQLGNLILLNPQAFQSRGAGRPQLRTVAVEGTKIEAVFAIEPAANLRRVRRQVRMFVSQCLTSPYVGLGVFDRDPAFGEAFGDVQPIGHGQAIRAAAYNSASA